MTEPAALEDPSVLDIDLLIRVQARDELALGALYERYGRPAFALAYRIVGDPELAEDVTQEAFLLLWQRAVTYQPERGTPRAWFLTIVHHRAIDARRASAARPVGADLDTISTLADPNEDTAGTVLAGLAQADAATGVRTALAGLPVEQRLVVERAYFEGLTYPEVAAALGVPLGTVKSRMRLALTRLRGLLAGADLPAAPLEPAPVAAVAVPSPVLMPA